MSFRVIISLLMSMLLFKESQQQDATVVLDPPQSVNAIEGDTVTFSCTARANEIEFFINGVSAGESSVAEKGFTASLVNDIDDSTRQQNLTAVARSDINNNTNITCRALTLEGTDVSVDISDPAVLLIQGPLSSVHLSYSFINSSTVNISWSPPFTLPGTDITGYNVTVMVSFISNTFTTNNYYIFYNYLHCDEVIIIVSGYNGLDGDNASILILEPIAVTNIELTEGNLVEGEQLVITLNVSSLCPDQYPTHINLTIHQYTSNGLVLVAADNIPLVSTNDTNILITSNNHNITLLMHNSYIATGTYSNLDNIVSILNLGAAMITDPPESHNVTLNTGSIKLSCTAISKSLQFLINGEVLKENHDGFSQDEKVMVVEPGKIKRNLMVDVSLAFHYVNESFSVVCWAYNNIEPKSEDLSEPAELEIQGELEEPGNINYYEVVNGFVDISWKAPYTLMGTNISGYNVTVDGPQDYHIHAFTEEENIRVMTLPYFPNCTELVIKISGYNGIDGEQANQSIYVPSNLCSTSSTLISSSSTQAHIESSVSSSSTVVPSHALSSSGDMVSSSAMPSSAAPSTANNTIAVIYAIVGVLGIILIVLVVLAVSIVAVCKNYKNKFPKA